MTYTIGQVAEIFNLSIHTLRYYEKEGLLPSVSRTESGIRQFTENDIEALKTIECLKITNMPLKEIKRYMEWSMEGDNTLEKRRDLFYERKEIVLDQISQLNRVLDTIKLKCLFYDMAIQLGSEEAVLNLPPEEIPEEVKALYEATQLTQK